MVAGLEVARALRDADIRLDHALEVIDFLAEEPSDYGLSCIGSRGMSGALDASMLALAAPGGGHLADALRGVGGDPDHIASARRDDIAAFLELHIEQGPVLEERGLDVGIVSSIVGIRRIEIVFEGVADHAGTTPMSLRRDALVAAANTVAAVRKTAERLAAEGAGYFVATVGILTVEPGGSNVVPRRCRLVIDARTTDTTLMARFFAEIDRESAAHAAAARVERRPLVTLSDGAPAACDPFLRDTLRRSAWDLGLGATDIASGAGHDAAFMSRICPSAMLFVPCRAGKSHAPEEWAEPAAVAAGAAVLLDAVAALDKNLPRRA